MQPDGTATLIVSMVGDSVSVSRIDNPNPFGTLTCQYVDTLRPDGETITGSATCQLNSGTSLALSWSAIIHCDPTLASWSDTAFWHRAAKIHQFSFDGTPDGTPQPLWGTDTYIEGSSICTAGVHAGAITLQDGGTVTIEILPGEPSYPGSTRNGVTSDTFPTRGQFDASFRVISGQTQQPTATPMPSTGVFDPRIVGRWISDDGAELDIDCSGVGHLVGVDPPVSWHIAAVNGHTVSGNITVELPSDYQDFTCDQEQYGTRLWGSFQWTFDDQYSSVKGTSSLCGGAEGDLSPMHRAGDGQPLNPTATPVSGVTSWDNFIGKWSTSFGDVEISSDGMATYVDADTNTTAHIYFQQEDAHTISGYWIEAESGANCGVAREGSNYWGRIRWSFDDTFSSFSGVWSYCDAEPSSDWSGTRIS